MNCQITAVHQMITSPPYNASKEYDENLSLKEYLDLLYSVGKKPTESWFGEEEPVSTSPI